MAVRHFLGFAPSAASCSILISYTRTALVQAGTVDNPISLYSQLSLPRRDYVIPTTFLLNISLIRRVQDLSSRHNRRGSLPLEGVSDDTTASHLSKYGSQIQPTPFPAGFAPAVACRWTAGSQECWVYSSYVEAIALPRGLGVLANPLQKGKT